MKTRIGFIGFGKMSSAIANGLVSSNAINHEDIRANDIRALDGVTQSSLKEIYSECQIIFLGIKPQNLSDLPVTSLNSNHILISILAGSSLSLLENTFGNDAIIIRAMPNTPALVGEGFTALCSNTPLPEKVKQTIETYFLALGKVIFCDEKDINAFTAISGSGPGFIFHIAKELLSAAVHLGVSEKDARNAIAQTLIGSGKLIQQSNSSLEELISTVRSPNGTTNAGLNILEESSLGGILSNCLIAARNRAEELDAK